VTTFGTGLIPRRTWDDYSFAALQTFLNFVFDKFPEYNPKQDSGDVVRVVVC
jgi:hypothetical protein